MIVKMNLWSDIRNVCVPIVDKKMHFLHALPPTFEELVMIYCRPE